MRRSCTDDTVGTGAPVGAPAGASVVPLIVGAGETGGEELGLLVTMALGGDDGTVLTSIGDDGGLVAISIGEEDGVSFGVLVVADGVPVEIELGGKDGPKIGEDVADVGLGVTRSTGLVDGAIVVAILGVALCPALGETLRD